MCPHGGFKGHLPYQRPPRPLPFTSTLLAIIIRVLWLRFLALFPSLCPPFLSPPSRLFRNISPLALARRATSSLILPTRSLNNADPRNLRRRNRLCVLVISVLGMEVTLEVSFTYPTYTVAFEERNCGNWRIAIFNRVWRF